VGNIDKVDPLIALQTGYRERLLGGAPMIAALAARTPSSAELRQQLGGFS
jgi:hypothetical protein